MRNEFGRNTWGREGVSGERGAGRDSEGPILDGELPSMGAFMTHSELLGESIGFADDLLFPDRTHRPRIAKIFFGGSFSLVPGAGAFYESSRTRMRPSPSETSTGYQVVLWSKGSCSPTVPVGPLS